MSTNATTVTVLTMTFKAAFVSMFETPPPSFCSRDRITPVFVRVKKASLIDRRCENRRTRWSPMTWLPACAVLYVCATSTAAVTANTMTVAATSRPRTGGSGLPPAGNRPSSKMRREQRWHDRELR